MFKAYLKTAAWIWAVVGYLLLGGAAFIQHVERGTLESDAAWIAGLVAASLVIALLISGVLNLRRALSPDDTRESYRGLRIMTVAFFITSLGVFLVPFGFETLGYLSAVIGIVGGICGIGVHLVKATGW